ncbi:MAG: type II toxin-antitoxin system RelB/DinJ family antitoxin [Leptospirales bacterium]
MASSTMIHVRIDEQIKKKAAKTLDAMGLSLSDAVRVFLVRVIAEKQMPFSLKVPNAETLSSMAEADEIIVAKRARYKTGADLIHDLEKTSGQ